MPTTPASTPPTPVTPSTSSNAAWYEPGERWLVVAGRAMVVREGSSADAVAIWRAVSAGAGAGDLLLACVRRSVSADGWSDPGAFAIAVAEPDGLRILVRAVDDVVVRAADGSEITVGVPGLLTWTEILVRDAVEVRIGSADAVVLPVPIGVVRAGALRWEVPDALVAPSGTEEAVGTDEGSGTDEAAGTDEGSGPDEAAGTDERSGPDQAPAADRAAGAGGPSTAEDAHPVGSGEGEQDAAVLAGAPAVGQVAAVDPARSAGGAAPAPWAHRSLEETRADLDADELRRAESRAEGRPGADRRSSQTLNVPAEVINSADPDFSPGAWGPDDGAEPSDQEPPDRQRPDRQRPDRQRPDRRPADREPADREPRTREPVGSANDLGVPPARSGAGVAATDAGSFAAPVPPPPALSRGPLPSRPAPPVDPAGSVAGSPDPDAAGGVPDAVPAEPAPLAGVPDFAVAGAAAAAGFDGDHDGMTQLAEDLPVGYTPPPLPAAPPPGTVLAALCPAGHPNAPHSRSCRLCGQLIVEGDPIPVPRPVLARIRLSTGELVDIDRAVVIGRSPYVSRVAAADLPRLVAVPSPNQDISRAHAEIRPEDWHLVVADLDSTNGTTVRPPGRTPQRLRPGQEVVVEPGWTVELGDGISFAVEAV